jgi:uncharacterized membrane protein
MIVSEFDETQVRGRIVLQPNHSWTWRANVLLVGTLMAVSGSVATLFAYQGMWLVVPFTFLEMLLLLACLYYCVRRTHLQEVLTFSPQHVVFERGVRRPQKCQEFERYFARFVVEAPSHPWYRKRIALRSHGRDLEIGSFLGSADKDRLIGTLQDMIQRLDAVPADSLPRQ